MTTHSRKIKITFLWILLFTPSMGLATGLASGKLAKVHGAEKQIRPILPAQTVAPPRALPAALKTPDTSPYKAPNKPELAKLPENPDLKKPMRRSGPPVTAHLKKATYLLGALAISSSASTQLMLWVDPELDFWQTYGNTLVGQLAVLTVIPLAPFMEPVTSTIRRQAFSATQDKTQQMARNSLEQQYDRLNSMYTLQEQNSIDRILNFRSTIRWNFQAARKAIENGDPETAIAEIGDAAMIGYHQFREIHPHESTVMNMVRTAFLHNMDAPEDYVEPVLKYIQYRDPEVYAGGARRGKIAPKDYYHDTIKSWLKKPDISPQIEPSL